MIRLQFLELKQISHSMAIQHSKLFVFSFLILFTFYYNSSAQDLSKFKVVVDAGHGGEDTGINSLGLKEKDIALNVALFIEEFLSRQNDIELIYTRSKDEFVGLKERTTFANDASADLFVSIHGRANSDREVHGVEIFFEGKAKNNQDQEFADTENDVIFLEKDYDKDYNEFVSGYDIVYSVFRPKDKNEVEQSEFFAKKVQQNLTENLNRNDRGLKQAKFLLLNGLNMPAVIINIGYLTNVEESYYLTSVTNQKQLAREIGNALIEYKNIVRNGKTDPKIEDNIPEETIVIEETKTEIKQSTSRPSYYVQVLASTNRIDITPDNFKGLDQITSIYEDDVFKYRYGKSNSYMKILDYLNEAKAHGYTDAYVVVYLNGQKITIKEALKLGGE